MTEGNQLRDFIYIDDLIDAIFKCIDLDRLKGQIINIASGISIKLKDLAFQVAENTNSFENLKIGEIPYRNSEIMDYKVDISKAATLLKWSPKTSLGDGLVKTISFYEKSILNEA
jgi:nucleoside-diphosphate-sugar epimerase